MSDQLESVSQKIAETEEEIKNIKALPEDNPERAMLLSALPSLYAYLAELQKKENILLQSGRNSGKVTTL